MKRNRENLSGPFTKIRGLLARLVVIAIIFLILFLIIGQFGRFLGSADYFKIKDVIARETDPASASNTALAMDLSYLKGRNIFSVSLSKESGYILESYPGYSKIRLVRVLPCRIFADFIKRKAVAMVKLYRFFAIDADGVLFDEPGQTQDPQLPVISGLETKIFGPKSGKMYNIRELALALDIIREAKRNKALKDYKIRKIDVANLSSASIFISPLSSLASQAKPDGLEVRIGQEDIADKIIILAGLVAEAKSEWPNIKYIDLRFKEPVIRLNDAKLK